MSRLRPVFRFRAVGMRLVDDRTGAVGTFSRTGSAARTGTDGVVKLIGEGRPRWGVGANGEVGLVLEPARTNSFTDSQDISQAAYVVGAVSKTTDTTTAPDGTATADSVLETATTATHTLARGTSAHASGAPQSFSVYVKPNGRTRVSLYATGASITFGAVFDLVGAGSVLTDSAAGGGVSLVRRIAALGDGWYRLEIAGTRSTQTTSTLVLALHASTTLTLAPSYAGDITKGVYVWGWQWETDQASPTSYVATTGSTATRNTDALTFPIAWDSPVPDDLTVYLRYSAGWGTVSGAVAGAPPLVTLGGGTTAPTLALSRSSSAGQLIATIDTATTDATQTITAPTTATHEVVARFTNLTTGGTTALDVGGGFGSASSAATAISALGDDLLTVGAFGGVLHELVVARGERTLAEMRAMAQGAP